MKFYVSHYHSVVSNDPSRCEGLKITPQMEEISIDEAKALLRQIDGAGQFVYWNATSLNRVEVLAGK